MGIPGHHLPNVKGSSAARAWCPSSHSQWGSQIWIEVWLVVIMIVGWYPSHRTRTHLLGPQNPLGNQAFSAPFSQKRHDLHWLDYIYLLQLNCFPLLYPWLLFCLVLATCHHHVADLKLSAKARKTMVSLQGSALPQAQGPQRLHVGVENQPPQLLRRFC